jgi:LytS/YehU family sensor histidine kinase
MNFSSLITYDRPYLYEWIITHTYTTILTIIDFYIIYSIIIPKFFNKKTHLNFFIITSLYFICFSWIYAFSINYLEIILNLIDGFQLITHYYLSAAYFTLLYIFLGGLFRLAIDGYRNQQQKALLEKQNVKSELSLLKSQINPHFLFNTLNTIHSFVKRDPDKAAHSIIKLSGIMRFILYNTTHDKIPLEKEINYLRDYITLQEFRLDNPDFVSFEIAGNPDNISIPPMLFIPFVENAFKHGEIKTPLPGIKIKLNITNPKNLNFTVENVVSSIDVQNNIQTSGGIGLENVKRRLQLIYPGRHKLKIVEENNRFIVHLLIYYD